MIILFLVLDFLKVVLLKKDYVYFIEILKERLGLLGGSCI